MQTTLSHLKATATRHAEQLRTVSNVLTLDLIVEDDLPDTVARRDEAKQHVEKLEAIATVAGLIGAIPDAFNREALDALQAVVRQAEALLAREPTKATLERAAEFEQSLPY